MLHRLLIITLSRLNYQRSIFLKINKILQIVRVKKKIKDYLSLFLRFQLFNLLISEIDFLLVNERLKFLIDIDLDQFLVEFCEHFNFLDMKTAFRNFKVPRDVSALTISFLEKQITITR